MELDLKREKLVCRCSRLLASNLKIVIVMTMAMMMVMMMTMIVMMMMMVMATWATPCQRKTKASIPC